MARKDKRLQLRPVDDSAPEPPPAARLHNPETVLRARELKPVRLGPAEEPGVNRRLDLPDRDEVELRTHQPGIDVLIEPETAPLELVEENWGEAIRQRQPIPWGWFALISLVIVGAVLWSLARWDKADEQTVRIRTEASSVLANEEKEEREAAALIDRIDATIRDFISATSVERLSRLVRQPKRVTPLMRAYYADKPVYSGHLNSIKSLQPLTFDQHGNFWLANLAVSDSNTPFLILEIMQDGKPLVDWETFVCYQPMKWDDFARQRPAGKSLDFRVKAEIDNFYSHEFSDPNQWACFRLTALNSDETLFGYARREGSAAQQLLDAIGRNPVPQTSVILRLSVPEGLRSHRGVVIEKLLSPRWIYLDPPVTGS